MPAGKRWEIYMAWDARVSQVFHVDGSHPAIGRDEQIELIIRGGWYTSKERPSGELDAPTEYVSGTHYLVRIAPAREALTWAAHSEDTPPRTAWALVQDLKTPTRKSREWLYEYSDVFVNPEEKLR